MNQTSIEGNAAEVAEIEKHKYFLSEQAGYDVGWEMAEQDWESHHAQQFRAGSRSDAPSGGITSILRRVFSRRAR